MTFILFKFAESLAIVASISTDAFAAGIAYGVEKIKVPFLSSALISIICSSMLFLSMVAGNTINNFIPPETAQGICFSILMIMGLLRLFDNCIKSYIRKHNSISLGIKANDLKYVLTVYADAECADSDNSKTLSAKEASGLAIALSLDSIAVGIGAAMSGVDYTLTILISILFTFLSIKIGFIIGKKLPNLIPFDMSYVSAILLILLAITRLF